MVDGTGLENRRRATYRGFESLPLRQNETFFGNRVRKRSFFFALAQREPDVFLGGVRFCRRETSAFSFSGKIEMHTS